MSALIFARLARSIELMVRGRTRTGRRSPLHEEVANLRAQLAAAEGEIERLSSELRLALAMDARSRWQRDRAQDAGDSSA